MTEEQLIEKLMKPRYKVIADYPHSPYQVGEQIEFSDSGNGFHCTTTRTWSSMEEDMVDSQNYFHIDKLPKYPHLFKPLAWYEERDVSEMPEYVKDSLGKVVKALYAMEGNTIKCYDISDDLFPYKWTHITPATSTEYNNFINKK